MGETAGYQGMIYYRHAYLAATSASKASIVGGASDTIALTGLSAAGFVASDTINLASTSGSTNDGDYTISSISASVITVTGSLSAQASSATVKINAIPGTALAGFYNWTINYGADAHEVTDFSDSGVRTYVPGCTNWTGTATKRYSSASSIASWVASSTSTAKHVRFFLRYEATPTASSIATYLCGSAYVTGADTTTPVDGVVEQTINFQGTGALTLTTKNNTWGS